LFFKNVYNLYTFQEPSPPPKRNKLNKEETEAAKAYIKESPVEYVLTTNNWWVTSIGVTA